MPTRRQLTNHTKSTDKDADKDADSTDEEEEGDNVSVRADSTDEEEEGDNVSVMADSTDEEEEGDNVSVRADNVSVRANSTDEEEEQEQQEGHDTNVRRDADLTDKDDDDDDDDVDVSLFTHDVMSGVLARLKVSNQFAMLRDTWSTKYKRTISVVSRDWLVLHLANKRDFINAEVKRDICEVINDLYLKRSLLSMFGIVVSPGKAHDMMCVLSKLSADPNNQSQWKLEAFIIGELHWSDDPAWWLSLVCNGNMRGIALSLVQSFVYAVKCYAEVNKVHAKTFLDLSFSYENGSAMSMYARTGFSSFCPLILDANLNATLGQVTTKYLVHGFIKHYMALDLTLFDKSVLLSNIGVLTPTTSSIDSIYCDLAKIVDTQDAPAHTTLEEAQDKFSALMTLFFSRGDPSVFAKEEAQVRTWMARKTHAMVHSMCSGFKALATRTIEYRRYSPSKW